MRTEGRGSRAGAGRRETLHPEEGKPVTLEEPRPCKQPECRGRISCPHPGPPETRQGSGPRAGRVTRTGWGRRWRLRFGDRLSPRDGFSLLRKENNEVHGVGLRNKQLEGFRNETVSPRGQAARPQPGTWAPRSGLASVHEATLLFVV